jgi:selenocysteine-specific elongation factor
MKNAVIAVVGHVDHGKSTLVKALTGIETDTLAEEQERGLSITLGFANRCLLNNNIQIIDTPGHADFIRMTACGLSGADAILLVVSCVDGVQAQTIEHLKIAAFMGIKRAVVALTKTDLARNADHSETIAAIEGILSRYGFEPAKIIPCEPLTGRGQDALLSALADLVETLPKPQTLPGFFLPVDRAFLKPGIGTVITGTLHGGALGTGIPVAIEPGGRIGAVRGLQVAGDAVDDVHPRSRVSIGLRGTDAVSVKRGDVICAASTFQTSTRFDVSLFRFEVDNIPLKHMEHVMALFGAAAAPARLRLFETQASTGAIETFGQLEFTTPQIAFAGQRFVLRRPASATTLAGGTILDPLAAKLTGKKHARVAILRAADAAHVRDIADAIAAQTGGVVEINELVRLARRPANAIHPELEKTYDLRDPGRAYRCADLDALQERVLAALAAQHSKRPCRPRLALSHITPDLHPAQADMIEWAIACLEAVKAIRIDNGGIALWDHDPLQLMSAAQLKQYADLEAKLFAMALKPTPLIEMPETNADQGDLIDLLIWNGIAVRLWNVGLKQSIILHASALTEARKKLADTFAGSTSFTTGEARTALDTNRKTIVPLLELFDQEGLTVREGDIRYLVE